MADTRAGGWSPGRGVANVLPQEVPGGRALVTRRPLGVVGVAWSGPRPLQRALELLPPALALGNALVVLAPPSGAGPALRLRQVGTPSNPMEPPRDTPRDPSWTPGTLWDPSWNPHGPSGTPCAPLGLTGNPSVIPPRNPSINLPTTPLETPHGPTPPREPPPTLPWILHSPPSPRPPVTLLPPPPPPPPCPHSLWDSPSPPSPHLPPTALPH